MKIIKTGQDARDALKRGIDLVAKCVSVTLGPSGRNAVLGRQSVTPIITNDGVTIAHSIDVEDEIEQQGVMIVKESAQLTDLNAGDGTTTTTVLLKAITDALFEKIKDDGSLVRTKIDTIKLKKEVDAACEKVVESLWKMAKPITEKDIYDVAIVSCEYPWMAKLLVEVFSKIGVDGYVIVEEANKTSFKVFNGIEINSGYPSEYFINNDNRECVIENPNIIVTGKELGIGELMPLINEMQNKGVDNLIVVAPNFSQDILNRFIATKVKTGISLIAVKQPVFGKNDPLLDIACLVNAVFIDDVNIKDISWNMVGNAEKIILNESKTMIIGGSGDTKDRVKMLKDKIDESDSEFDKDELRKRIAFLSGGVAVIKVGAESQFEKTYFKLKIEDAINAVQSALKDGVVKGGGLALKEVSETLPENILTKPILAPYLQIQENSGGNLDIPDTVVDPVKTTVSAIKSACSLAGMLITTEVAVAYKNQKKEDDK